MTRKVRLALVGGTVAAVVAVAGVVLAVECGEPPRVAVGTANLWNW